MTPGARLSAAIEILDSIEQSKTAAESIVRAYFRSRRYAGSKDRRAIGERVYAVIRHRARIDWWIAGAAGDLEPGSRIRVLASLLLLDQETQKSVAELTGTLRLPLMTAKVNWLKTWPASPCSTMPCPQASSTKCRNG